MIKSCNTLKSRSRPEEKQIKIKRHEGSNEKVFCMSNQISRRREGRNNVRDNNSLSDDRHEYSDHNQSPAKIRNPQLKIILMKHHVRGMESK